jgi:superoxide reductase
MIEKAQVYRCEICGNVVEILHAGTCVPSCCDQPMKPQEANSVDASKEKHVPVIEKTATGFKVSVGSVAHPMEEKHFIEWIEIRSGNQVLRAYLKPGEAPVAEFALMASSVEARAYCNLHGLWKAKA